MTLIDPNIDKIIEEKLNRLDLLEARESQARRGGLIEFVRYFWHVLEPNTPFVEGWAMEAICLHLEAIAFGDINRLLIVVPPGFCKSLLTDVFFPAWLWSAFDAPHMRIVAFSYSASLTERDNAKFRDLLISPEFKEVWGYKFELRKVGEVKVTNDKTGWKLASSVGGVGTGERGNLVLLDDPHSIKNVESEVVREETVRWFREAMSNRLNDMQNDAIIAIMQRSHEADVAGTIIAKSLGYCVLSIDMEFDITRQTVGIPNEIGWVDPRSHEGELAWPERFSREVCVQTRNTIGKYAWCTPGESPILMADLSLRRIEDVRVGDKVIGFEIGNDEKRARLKPATVLAISKSVQEVNLVKLDSGKTARCTADHKWYTGRTDPTHKTYAPAKIGMSLKRVCPPSLPETSTDEDSRMAGWLAGFFDGEGSVSLLHRRSGEGSSLITFTQGCEKNLSICEKLETVLNRLGFNWGYKETAPSTLSASGVPWQRRRAYYLKSDAAHGRTKNGTARRASRLELNQRFLHLVQPVKWRDRLIDTTANGRMYTATERVVSIEPDGVETVYGLTTETGNYVVWGLASSNSAQYQQMPSPRGGGIIQSNWWRLWDQTEARKYGLEWGAGLKEFPPFDLVVGSLDTAYGEKQENDFSALTVWGIWVDMNKNRRAMLMFAWAKRLPLHGTEVVPVLGEAKVNFQQRQKEAWGLIELVSDTCKRYKVRRLLIEDKNRGRDVAEEINRLYFREGWGVELVNPVRDKVSRTHSVVPLFTDGVVWAPETRWSDAVLDQTAKFPRDAHDDLHDTVTQFLNWAREGGLLIRGDEYTAALEEEMQYRPRVESVANMYGV